MMWFGSWVGRSYMPEKGAGITKARGCSFKALDFPWRDRHEDRTKVIQIPLAMGPCTWQVQVLLASQLLLDFPPPRRGLTGFLILQIQKKICAYITFKSRSGIESPKACILAHVSAAWGQRRSSGWVQGEIVLTVRAAAKLRDQTELHVAFNTADANALWSCWHVPNYWTGFRTHLRHPRLFILHAIYNPLLHPHCFLLLPAYSSRVRPTRD